MESRRSGQTTRIVDKLVQELFNQGFCYVEDHYTSVLANKLLLKQFIGRLEREHNLIVEEDLKVSRRVLGTNFVEFKGKCSGNG